MTDAVHSPFRITAIKRSGLLDRKGSEQFGHLTEHVRAALDVPVSIVSIVDEDRQVFAGHCGLPEPWASQGETPMTHSFCQHVVEANKPLIVRDANIHELVMHNAAIQDIGVVAYLGVPICLPTGEVVGALAAIDTEPREWTARDQRALETLAKIVEKEIAVGISELKYRRLFEDMQEGYYLASAVRTSEGKLADITFEDINPAFERMTGMASKDVIGSTLSALFPDVVGDMLPAFDRVLSTGDPLLHSNQATALGGRWFENRIRRLDGDMLSSVFNDISDRKRAEGIQQVVNREMSHRLKNTLAMVQAIANQTLRPVTEREHVESFQHRIAALSSAHDILLNENRDVAPIRDIITETLQRLAPSDRIDLEGPDTMVGPKGTLSLALLLHELSTNAVKYGALSNESGRVAIAWHTSGTGSHEMFHLSWRESGGPTVAEPGPKGFGSKLIRMGLIGAGGVGISYDPSGFSTSMTAPLGQLQHTD